MSKIILDRIVNFPVYPENTPTGQVQYTDMDSNEVNNKKNVIIETLRRKCHKINLFQLLFLYNKDKYRNRELNK